MKIVHISDIHCNFGSDFNEKIFDKAACMVNKIDADFVFISGDLTYEGLLSEYELAKEKIKQINHKLVIIAKRSSILVAIAITIRIFISRNFFSISDL